MIDENNFFFVQPVERWLTPSWERIIPEHDIIQQTQIITDVFILK